MDEKSRTEFTEALREIIEPVREGLITTAQAHYLASIRQELGDALQHAERAMELISELIPEDTEPHWTIRPEYRDVYTGSFKGWAAKTVDKSPPPDGPPGGHLQMGESEAAVRNTPRVGETWLFSHRGFAFTAVILEEGRAEGIPEVARDSSSGKPFKFNSIMDPMPVRKIGPKMGPPPDEPKGPYTDNSPEYQRMTEETDTY